MLVVRWSSERLCVAYPPAASLLLACVFPFVCVRGLAAWSTVSMGLAGPSCPSKVNDATARERVRKTIRHVRCLSPSLCSLLPGPVRMTALQRQTMEKSWKLLDDSCDPRGHVRRTKRATAVLALAARASHDDAPIAQLCLRENVLMDITASLTVHARSAQLD